MAEHVLEAPFQEGNAIEALVNGDQVFPAMLNAIAGATNSIVFENYIWSSGEVSAGFVAALSERARSGVEVRVVIDWLGGRALKQSAVRAMREAGVEVHFYNPMRWWEWVFPWRLNHRTHRKILVADGRVAFTGGACISDHWVGDAHRPDVYRETHFRFEGPAAGAFQGAFVENWIESARAIPPWLDPGSDTAGSARVQVFKSGPGDAVSPFQVACLLAIGGAREQVQLAHGYFIPDRLFTEALVAARRRGVRVQVIVGGRTDFPPTNMAARSKWGPLLEAGVEFYRYRKALYHSKVMIVDGRWIVSGTGNIDSRSFYINDEVTFQALDDSLAAQLTALFEIDKSYSVPLSLDEYRARSALTKFLDRFFGLFAPQF